MLSKAHRMLTAWWQPILLRAEATVALRATWRYMHQTVQTGWLEETMYQKLKT